MKLKICFVLPGIGRQINGGYKVIYQYANMLAADNFCVQLLYINDIAYGKIRIPKWIKNIYCNFLIKKEPTWFNLNPKIQKISANKKNYKSLIKGTNIAIATSAETVNYVKKLFKPSKKIYFIQGYEKWSMNLKDLNSTYKENFKKIVISKSLEKIVNEYSLKPAIYIPNGINTNLYKVKTPIPSRSKYVIGVLYNPNPEKGFKYAYNVLLQLKKDYPKLKVLAFGTFKQPKFFPKWISYVYKASNIQTVKIYNNINIFLNTSINEGFGLTGLEAMACGAALVSTNYAGVNEYAINNENALLSPIKDCDGLIRNVEYLIENESFREKIAFNGAHHAKLFSEKLAYEKFKKVINQEKK